MGSAEIGCIDVGTETECMDVGTKIECIDVGTDVGAEIACIEMSGITEGGYGEQVIAHRLYREAALEVSGVHVKGLGLRVEGQGHRVEGQGLRVEGLGSRGQESRVKGLGSRVWGEAALEGCAVQVKVSPLAASGQPPGLRAEGLRSGV
eukprot:1814098-Rhodomonas_salina.2